MAMLIQSIAVAGARRSDGTAAASGFVYLYSPGTTSPVSGYRDNALSQTWTTTNGGIQLDSGGRASIWVNQKVDVAVYDSSGALVTSLIGFNGVPAAMVEVQNAGYTGAITDPATGAVTQGAGGLTDLNTVLTNLAASTGGIDGLYQESASATPRKIRDVIRLIQVTPQDFKAQANGANDDTPAVLAAIAELARLGSGELYFPPGTYALTGLLQIGTNVASQQGLSIRGAGSGSSILKWTSGTIGLLAYGTRARIQGVSFANSIGSDVNATYLDIENAANVIVEDVIMDAKCRVACKVGSSSEVMLRANKFAAANGDALAVGLVISESTGIRAIGNSIIGGSSGVGIWDIGTSASGNHLIDGNSFSNCGLAGVVFQGSSGTVVSGVSLVNNHSLGSLTTPILASGTTYQGVGASYPSDWIQQGNNVDGLTADVTSGGTVTPLLSKGRYFRYKGTTTGSAYNVNAPDAIPSVPIRGTIITIEFVNAAGGAVTGWTLDAIYKTTASIPTTDGHSIQVQFAADPNGSGFGGNWREISRSDTTT